MSEGSHDARIESEKEKNQTAETQFHLHPSDRATGEKKASSVRVRPVTVSSQGRAEQKLGFTAAQPFHDSKSPTLLDSELKSSGSNAFLIGLWLYRLVGRKAVPSSRDKSKEDQKNKKGLLATLCIVSFAHWSWLWSLRYLYTCFQARHVR